MKVIVLSHGSWQDYRYKRLLELLPERGEVVFAGSLSEEERRQSGIQAASLGEIAKLGPEPCTALVSSPYWLPELLALRPAYTVAFIEPCPEGEEAGLWNKYSSLLAARADLVATVSERIYLEQNLRRSRVVYLGGDERLSYGLVRREGRLLFLADYEAVWRGMLAGLWRSAAENAGLNAAADAEGIDSAADYGKIQLRRRTEYYKALCVNMPGQPAVHYLAASYLYLLGEYAAMPYAKRAFELMLLQGHCDCLHSHYRFFSAIEAKNGNLDLAVSQYAITAFTSAEKAKAEELRRWLEAGGEYRELVRAELFRVNEDAGAAVRILERSALPEAGPLLLQSYLDAYQWEQALALLHKESGDAADAAAGDAKPLSPADGLAEASVGAEAFPLSVVEGTLNLLHGRRHAAIRSFLRAAGADRQARPLFAEMADLEEALQRLRGRSSDE